jgi:hypothetical protein
MASVVVEDLDLVPINPHPGVSTQSDLQDRAARAIRTSIRLTTDGWASARRPGEVPTTADFSATM